MAPRRRHIVRRQHGARGAGDPDLAERVARAIGTELRAVGVNVNYAPV